MKLQPKDLFSLSFAEAIDMSIPRLPLLLALFGILVLTAFVIAGGHNTDEGWYLAASVRIASGDMPFKDFAFTQMPLLPYAYLPAIMIAKAADLPILLVSRAESAIFCIVSCLASIKTASRIGGKKAEVISLLLISISFSSLYFMAIIKTYALVSACFSLSILLVCRGEKNAPNYLLSSVFIILAACTRLSVLPSAAVLIGYSLFRLIKIRRLSSALVLILGLLLAVATFFYTFMVHNPDAFLWGIIKHHSDQWAGHSGKLLIIARRFAQLTILTYVFIITVFYLVATQGWRIAALKLIQDDNSERFPIPAIASSLFVFVLANSISGGFHLEYFVPIVFPLLSVYASIISRISIAGGAPDKLLKYIVLVSAATILALNAPAMARISASQMLDPGKIRYTSDAINVNSSRSNSVFALEALMPILEAKRKFPSSITMSSFSFNPQINQGLSKKINLVSDQGLIDQFNSKSCELVLLTDWDLEKMYGSRAIKNPIQGNIEPPGRSQEIRLALDSNYSLIKEIDDYGQFRSTLYLYKINR